MKRLLITLVALTATTTSLVHCGDDDPVTSVPGTNDAGSDTSQPTTDSGNDSSTPGDTGSDAPTTRKLDANLTWHGQNRQKLDDLMAQKGIGSAGYDPNKKPVAAFDWDNTVIKNDIGDATFFWMLRNNKILQPPSLNWRLTSPFLTVTAATALATACPVTLAAAGSPLPTSTSSGEACAKEIVTIYTTAKTVAGSDAFQTWDYRRMEPAYAWAAQLQAGYTPAESKAFATSAAQENISNAVDTNQTIGGTVTVKHWLRVYDQMKNLIETMQANGFDVWIVSASPQPWVEAIATRVNVNADHVIGIRLVEQAGKLTYNIQGCGGIPDGTNDGAGAVTGNSMITYIEGKRCWINKVL
jgi:hypothetical protein